MKLKKLVFSLLIFGIWMLFFLTGSLLAYNLEEYYPLDEGNTWIYSLKANDNGTETTEQEIVKIKGTEKFGEVETKKMISAKVENQCIAIDSEGVKLYKAWGWSGVGGDYEVYNPPKMLFPSLEIGENKTYPITIVPYQIDDVAREINKKSGTLTITLDSTENVEVPAGKFKNCLKFISVFEFKKVNKFGDEQTPSKQTVITWLAPGVGKVKSELTLSEYIGLPDRKIDELTELMELKEATVNGNKLP